MDAKHSFFHHKYCIICKCGVILYSYTFDQIQAHQGTTSHMYQVYEYIYIWYLYGIVRYHCHWYTCFFISNCKNRENHTRLCSILLAAEKKHTKINIDNGNAAAVAAVDDVAPGPLNFWWNNRTRKCNRQINWNCFLLKSSLDLAECVLTSITQ